MPTRSGCCSPRRPGSWQPALSLLLDCALHPSLVARPPEQRAAAAAGAASAARAATASCALRRAELLSPGAPGALAPWGSPTRESGRQPRRGARAVRAERARLAAHGRRGRPAARSSRPWRGPPRASPRSAATARRPQTGRAGGRARAHPDRDSTSRRSASRSSARARARRRRRGRARRSRRCCAPRSVSSPT